MIRKRLRLTMYRGRMRAEERTGIPLVRHRIRHRCLDYPLVFYSEVIGIAVKRAVAVFAAQDNDALQLADRAQRSAHGGATHLQQFCDTADGRERLLVVTRLLEQAQTYAEGSVGQLPLEYLARDQGIVLRHRKQAGVGGLSITHASDLLLVLVAAAEINAAGALQFFRRFAGGGNGAAGQLGQSVETDGALAKVVAAAVQGGSHPAGAVRERLIVQEATGIPKK